jgi:hypothetical protein
MVRDRRGLAWLAALAVVASGCAPEIPRFEEGRQLQPTPAPQGDGGLDPLPPPPGAPSPSPPSPPSPGADCGNGELETGEVCDGDKRSCAEIDPDTFAGGVATCNLTCSGYDVSGCTKPMELGDALATITEADLKQEVGVIASDGYGGRYPGSSGDVATRTFLVNALKSAGVEPAVSGSYLQQFSCGGTQTANVIGRLPGSDPVLKEEVVILGAHHDHLGTTSNYGCSDQGGNNICNGADDNGTGTVAVLAAAQALARLKGQNRRTLLFALFGAEEQGLVGSKHYVGAPLHPLGKTAYMINIDMVGYSSGGNVSALGAERSQLASQWLKDAASKHGVTPQLTFSAGGGSDHYHFAVSQVPYVFFHTGLSPCYHATCDTADKIHYPEYTKITRAVAHFMWSIAQADQSPRSDFSAPTSCGSPTAYTDWKLFVDHQAPPTDPALP